MGYIKFKNIVTGWKNIVFKNPVIEEIAISRILICSECPSAIQGTWLEAIIGESEKVKKAGTICSECKCPIQAKSRVPVESCPLKKWGEKEIEPRKYINPMRLNTYIQELEKVMVALSYIKETVHHYPFKEEERKKMKGLYLQAVENYYSIKNALYEFETGKPQPTKQVMEDIRFYSRSIEKVYDENIVPKIAFSLMQETSKTITMALNIFSDKRIVFATKGNQIKPEDASEGEYKIIKNIEDIMAALKENAV